MRNGIARGLALAVALIATPARAQSDENKAAADSLFDEGKKLLAAGDVDHACPKFQASLKLADRLGVRLNLADCYEKEGRTASAWAEFREAATRAEEQADKRAEFAHQRADALAPKLVKVQIDVPADSRVRGLVVRRDGMPVPAEAFGTPFPVNPGGYVIDAAAPGFRTWSSRVDTGNPGETVSIVVPRLVTTPEVAKSVEPSHDKPPLATADGEREVESTIVDRSAARHTRHVIGLAVGGAGVAALGAGVALGFEAKHKWDSAGSHCAGSACDGTGTAIDRSARTLGNIGTVTGVVGIAGIVVGGVIYFTAPHARSVVEHARIEIAPQRTTVEFATSF